MEMNGQIDKTCSNSSLKCLSDSEHTREYFDNRSLRENSPPKFIIPSYCSDEIMSQHRSDTFSNPGISRLNAFPSQNIPRKVQFTSIDHIDSVPKAFIERSFHPQSLDFSDKKRHLAELIAQIESDNSETSNQIPDKQIPEMKSFNFDDNLKFNTPEPFIDYQPPFEPSPRKPVASKRQQPIESYISEDSNFSAIADEFSNTYPHYTTPFYYQMPAYSNYKNSNFSYDSNCSFPFSLTNDFSSMDNYNSDYIYTSAQSQFTDPDISSQSDARVFKKHADLKPKKAAKIIDIPKFEEIEFSKPIKDTSSFSSDREFGTVQMAKDQHGSRLIQQKIENASADELTRMINELAQDEKALIVLVGDVFGNYVIQKLLDYGNQQHRMSLVQNICGNILHLAVQVYGCRVVQKAIECGSMDIQLVIIQEIKGHVLECIKDQNGNHVIQKCIERIDSSMLMFIISEISGHVVELSTHPYGCRVIQRILERFETTQKLKITEELFDEIPSLVLDQYGNYVVQHILDYCNNSCHRDYVFDYVKNHLFILSSHKFASNVVEKCLVSGSHAERRQLMSEIIDNSVGTEDDIVYKMMKDAFANYVIQKMIDVIITDKEHDLFNDLVSKIRPHYPSLRKISYGKHIINKIDKICSKICSRSSTLPRPPPTENHSTLKSFHVHYENGSKVKDIRSGIKNNDKKQVICDSLIEFPSLIGEDSASVSD